MPEPTPQPNIYQRLHAVMAKVGYVQQDEKAPREAGGYVYASHNEIVRKVRPALLEHGIYPRFCLSEAHTEVIETKTGKKILTVVSGMVQFINIDSPDQVVEIPTHGHGLDNTDKTIGIALTYAKKNGLSLGLLLEAGKGEDPDANKANLGVDSDGVRKVDQLPPSEDASDNPLSPKQLVMGELEAWGVTTDNAKMFVDSACRELGITVERGRMNVGQAAAICQKLQDWAKKWPNPMDAIEHIVQKNPESA